MSDSAIDQVLDVVRKRGIVRPRELDRYGLPRQYLHRLYQCGELVRLGRGLYALPDHDLTEHHDLAEASTRVPHGVACLLSALRFHDLTTQLPRAVWMAIEQKAWRPEGLAVPLRLVYMSGEAFEAGIETHEVEGVAVRVYSAAKTVADCFKFRNKIGLDVATEALRDYRRLHRQGLDNLWRFAKIDRVDRVMRPYLDMLS
ncbi:MAG: type IV toxin-antitoxin system AbiEi family antitoxin domain-containing protein [Rhodothermales bacterium]